MSHLSLQIKYLRILSTRLERFKDKGNYIYNFRCPYCGDSEKNTKKARGYIYKNKNGLLSFHCHNCGEHHSFKKFLEYVDPNLYKEYVFESLGKNIEEKEIKKEKEEKVIKEWRKYLISISQLKEEHPALRYIKERKIPEKKYDRIFFTHNLRDFLSKISIEKNVPEESRILFVETDRFDNLKIVVARTFENNKKRQRYITIKLDEKYPKLFGLSKIDLSKQVYIVEGAIDSLFLDNCIATLDSNLLAYKKYSLDIGKPVLIWDNEPRNKQICNLIKKAIQDGEKVVIFPNELKDKDLNDMVINKIDIKNLIEKRIFQGVNAILEFSKWRK